MKQLIKLSLLATITASLFGCASPNMKMSKEITTNANIKPDPGKALVYFIRPGKVGFKVSAAVYDDTKFIGMVPYSTKLPYQATPGKHTFMVVSESADFMTADLAAGKTYYAQVVPRMGAWRARFSLAPMTEARLKTTQTQQWIDDAILINNSPNAYDWAKRTSDSVAKKRAVNLPKWQQKAEKPHLKATDGM